MYCGFHCLVPQPRSLTSLSQPQNRHRWSPIIWAGDMSISRCLCLGFRGHHRPLVPAEMHTHTHESRTPCKQQHNRIMTTLSDFPVCLNLFYCFPVGGGGVEKKPSGILVSLAIYDAPETRLGGKLESWWNSREAEHAGRFVLFFACILSRLEGVPSQFNFTARQPRGIG